MLTILQGLDDYLVPYIIVQFVGIGFLATANWNTRLARLLFSILFLYAAFINLQLGLKNPDVYLEYGEMALPFYRDFIQGWFSKYNHIMVPAIAFGQFLIGIGMLLQGWWVRWACTGVILFLMAIAPLMVGSGFPFSLVASIAAWLILQNDEKYVLWHNPHGNAAGSGKTGIRS